MHPSSSSAQWSRGGARRATATGLRDAPRTRKAPVPPNVAAPLSQWKQLRQTVAVRQEVVEDGEPTQLLSSVNSRIRISHLCPEDKQKVGKLIRQLMKVGSENEHLRKELDDVKAVLDQAIADKDDLQTKLAQSLDMLKTYQARMHSMQTQSELDQGKMTAAAADMARFQQQAQDHAHALQVLRLDHDDAMRKASRQWEIEMERLREEVLAERRERLHLTEHLSALERNLENKDPHSDDLSTLLNLSTADKMRDIVLEWKHRMDAALEPVLPAPVTSSHTQTDPVGTHTIGLQFGRSSLVDGPSDAAAASPRAWSNSTAPDPDKTRMETASLPPVVHRMLPMRTSMVDSEFYDLSLLDLVQAMEGVHVSTTSLAPPSTEVRLRQSLGPLTADDLSMRRPPVELDMDAILTHALP